MVCHRPMHCHSGCCTSAPQGRSLARSPALTAIASVCRLQVRSNDLHKVVADAAVEHLNLKSANAQRSIEAAHLRSFKESLGDDTVAGLCVMLATALWYSWTNGFLNIHLGRYAMFA